MPKHVHKAINELCKKMGLKRLGLEQPKMAPAPKKAKAMIAELLPLLPQPQPDAGGASNSRTSQMPFATLSLLLSITHVVSFDNDSFDMNIPYGAEAMEIVPNIFPLDMLKRV